MTDAQAQPAPQPPAPVAQSDENRVMTLIVYGLFIAAVVCAGVSGIAGVIVAYIKRGEAHGTVWESHFDNQINTFWAWFGLCVLGVATFWIFGLGLVVIGIAFIWFLYRTIKGLILALDSKPFA